jgi:hypothetical protein
MVRAERAEQSGAEREGKRRREWPHRIHPRCPVVFRISDIHESGVGLSNDSTRTRGPLGGPSIKIIASLGSATDLDAIPASASSYNCVAVDVYEYAIANTSLEVDLILSAVVVWINFCGVEILRWSAVKL